MEVTEKDFSNPNLLNFWETGFFDEEIYYRYLVLSGGRSSTKSWDAATVAVLLSDECSMKFLCCRQLQNRIDQSVYTLLVQRIYDLGLSKRFKITNNKIVHKRTKSSFVFYGLWRHIEEIKSFEGADVCWIEEAHALTESQYKLLVPTVRKEGSQFWIIFNPDVATDFIYQRFVINPPPRTLHRHINYDENPYLTKVIREEIEALKEEDEDEYRHIYLGEPYDDDDSVIIKRKWLTAATDAHLKLDFPIEGQKRIGFDVADDGGDRCVNVFAHGNVATGMESWKANEDELIKSSKRTYNNALETQSMVTYDALSLIHI